MAAAAKLKSGATKIEAKAATELNKGGDGSPLDYDGDPEWLSFVPSAAQAALAPDPFAKFWQDQGRKFSELELLN
jgi:hypothetical protein